MNYRRGSEIPVAYFTRSKSDNIEELHKVSKRVLRSNSLMLNGEKYRKSNKMTIQSAKHGSRSNVCPSISEIPQKKRKRSSCLMNSTFKSSRASSSSSSPRLSPKVHKSNVFQENRSTSSRLSIQSELVSSVDCGVPLDDSFDAFPSGKRVNTSKLGKMKATKSRKMEAEDDLNESKQSELSVIERDLLHSTSLLDDPKGKLLQLCNQSDLKSFSGYFDEETLNNLVKLGEGVYGEVYQVNAKRQVIKIFPVEGSELVNGEKQMSYSDVYSEIYVSQKLSELGFRHTANRTVNFTQLKKSTLVRGKLLDVLAKKWKEYRRIHGSENECLDFLADSQEWIILEFDYGGIPLANMKFNSCLEAKSIFEQVAISLAVAESALQFEHRDLHWFNILVRPTRSDKLRYKVKGEHYVVLTYGVQATIIDFTVSRLCYDGNIVYLDMADSSVIFDCYGDYQYDIYRIMKQNNDNQWRLYRPQTNLYWLHYLLHKLMSETSYPRRDPNMNIIESELKTLLDTILKLNYKSATDLISSNFYFDGCRRNLT